jgi:hypothetical protein
MYYMVIEYNRKKAVRYAHKWAYGRNPAYYDFENIGGDCTNFASQVIYAGSGIMNCTPIYGWYYRNSYDRTASWTGVNYLYRFLVSNEGQGPFAELVQPRDVLEGDIVQLSFSGGGMFNHSPIIVDKGVIPSPENILLAAHTFDRDYFPLASYNWIDIRYIHITGVRR